MSGQWIEDRTTPSGWRYDDTPADPTPTLITNAVPAHQVGTPRQEPAMSQDPIPSSRDVYDPSIGADGGQGGELAAIDPDNPVTHVDELTNPSAQPATPSVNSGAAPVCCPTCGSGVHPNRLRG
jgi:hypothetical protein